MALFRRNKTIQLNADAVAKYSDKVAQIPDDLMARCPKCHKVYFTKQKPEDYCCMHCHHHLPFPAMERIDWLVDEGSFQEINADLWNDNPLGFPKYSEKLAKLQEATGLKEAIVTGTGRLDGHDLALGVMDSRFVMASMGTAVGEKLVQLFDLATAQGLPVVLYIASGGARMQEGILSLMQMAKVSQAVARHSAAGGFYCAVLTHPTTGGVTASFAMQGDVILAEPDATVGFAGKRVIEQTLRKPLPDDFQAAETVLGYGFIDQIVPRDRQKRLLAQLLTIHEGGKAQ